MIKPSKKEIDVWITTSFAKKRWSQVQHKSKKVMAIARLRLSKTPHLNPPSDEDTKRTSQVLLSMNNTNFTRRSKMKQVSSTKDKNQPLEPISKLNSTQKITYDKCLVWYIFLSTFLILCVLILKVSWHFTRLCVL